MASSTRGASAWVGKMPTGLPDWISRVSSSPRLLQRFEDRVVAVPVARGAADAAVDDEFRRVLGDVGIEVVLQHPVRRFGQPGLAVQLAAARGADGAAGILAGGHRRLRCREPAIIARPASALRAGLAARTEGGHVGLGGGPGLDAVVEQHAPRAVGALVPDRLEAADGPSASGAFGSADSYRAGPLDKAMSVSPPIATAVGYHDSFSAVPSMSPPSPCTIASRPRSGAAALRAEHGAGDARVRRRPSRHGRHAVGEARSRAHTAHSSALKAGAGAAGFKASCA